MDFFKKNTRILLVVGVAIFAFFTFFSIYLTGSYEHKKNLQEGLDVAREQREVAFAEQVAGPNTSFTDPLAGFVEQHNLSKADIKELDQQIKGAQIVYKNSFITVLSQLMLGLDLVGGAQLTFQAVPSKDTPINDETIAGLIKVFENRVNASGTTEAIVQQVGKDRILVEIPGADPQIVKRRLLKTAFLEFKEPVSVNPNQAIAPEPELPAEAVQAEPQAVEEMAVEIMEEPPMAVIPESLRIDTGLDPILPEMVQPSTKKDIEDPNLQENIDPTAMTPEPPQNQQVWKETGITGRDLKRAQAVSDGAGNWLIQFSFKGEAITEFGKLTERLIGQPIAIFLDGMLISSPTVRSAITGGEGQIEGRFTPEEAQDLAVQLNAGALPVPVKIIQERSVGATLGQDSIDKSLSAGFYGILLVILFMVLFYRVPGLISGIALLLYTMLSLAIFENTITLTLAGIAGFILSIGMAVDANILIFERTKEELIAGKNLFAAIDAGFDRAFSSIFDSNINTLIACVVLLIFGTGIIRGFAITLAIGVLLSMFSAIFVTKTLLLISTNFEFFRKPSFYGVRESK